MKTYKIKDKEFEITGYEELTDKKGNTKSVPILNMPFMSDYKFQLSCLNDRIEHPERYEAFEDVPAVIEKLKKWLKENEPCINNAV